MNKRLLACLCLLLALSVFAGGCSWRIEAVDQLIRAPKLSGEYASLDKAFKDYLKAQNVQNSILKPPLSGEYRSAYVLYDINGNGMNDALIFYAYTNDPNVVRVNILSYDGNKWFPVADYKGDGHNVHSVEFADLNRDGVDEVLISWQFSDSGNKNLSIIGCDLNDERQIIGAQYLLSNEEYTQKVVVDLNLDGTNELFTATIVTPEQRSVGKLLNYNQQERKIMPEENGIIDLDVRASAYRPLKTDVVGSGEKKACRIYIDAVVQQSPATMATEIVVWDSVRTRLLSPTLSAETRTVGNDTLRTAKLEESRDINSDRQIDIPTYSKLPDSKVRYTVDPKTEDLYIVEWKNYTDDLFKQIVRYIDYDNNAFRFMVPEGFDNFSVFIHATDATGTQDNNKMEFDELDPQKKESGEPLFTIYSFTAAQWETEKISGRKLEFLKRNQTRNTVYACEIFERGKARGINAEWVNKQLWLLKEEEIR
ncbi:MAG: VCBS repeat-containing protein [Oscillospiraceae bacterium]|jgi:hypothetical protein|nr:VCBS repeat-containing protein [Oscillospiraceae bacterium]